MFVDILVHTSFAHLLKNTIVVLNGALEYGRFFPSLKGPKRYFNIML